MAAVFTTGDCSPDKSFPLGSWTFKPDGYFLGALLKMADNQRDTDCLRNMNSLRSNEVVSRPLGVLHELSLRLVRNCNPELVTLQVYVQFKAMTAATHASRTKAMALTTLLENLDSSAEAFRGLAGVPSRQRVTASYEAQRVKKPESLHHIFNTLPSPRPDAARLDDDELGIGPFAAAAMLDLLNPAFRMDGLRTDLFTIQRRSAAMMIERECAPRQVFDPRMDRLRGPFAHNFFVDRVQGVFKTEPGVYDQARGGILAEAPGTGKTLTCLALICATKSHRALLPADRDVKSHATDKCQSLRDMAARVAVRHNLPWKAFFEDRERTRNESYSACETLLGTKFSSYDIEIPKRRGKRAASTNPDLETRTIFLSSVTLIVVPGNLQNHWEAEIMSHFESMPAPALRCHSVNKRPFPPIEDILEWDILLITRHFFDNEMVCVPNGFDARGARAEGYVTPLQRIHFLRVILDEGHDFVTSDRSPWTISALRALRVDRRWLVTGTPSNALVGRELQNASQQQNPPEEAEADASPRRDIADLGTLMQNFLDVKPWSNPEGSGDEADWNEYVLPRAGKSGTVDLRPIVQSVMIRHCQQDREKEVQLPPLSVQVVRLTPCFFDKLSINLFLAVLAVNAVTSERSDQDYMFHARNRTPLNNLVQNLQRSGFFWNGFIKRGMRELINNVWEYNISPGAFLTSLEDSRLLEDSMNVAELALGSQAWNAFSKSQQMGIVVTDLPRAARDEWALCPPEITFAPCGQKEQFFTWVSATKLRRVQASMGDFQYDEDPFDSLISHDSKAEAEARKRNAKEALKRRQLKSSKLGPSAGAVTPRGEKALTVKLQSTLELKKPLRKPTGRKATQSPKSEAEGTAEAPEALAELVKPLMLGTPSAKLTYLMDRIGALQGEEKILVWYEADFIKAYISEALDLMQVPHDIYAARQTPERHTRCLESFANDPSTRVLLMDLRQAAHGLNVIAATRVFFVNPVWSTTVEIQAIKRAHRIGQTRPVHVETLVLAGSLEEQMLQRRERMTRQDQLASKSLIDDVEMRRIIEGTPLIPFTRDEMEEAAAQYAPLQMPLQIFARGFAAPESDDDDDEDVDDGDEDEAGPSGTGKSAACGPPPKKRARFADFVDDDGDVEME